MIRFIYSMAAFIAVVSLFVIFAHANTTERQLTQIAEIKIQPNKNKTSQLGVSVETNNNDIKKANNYAGTMMQCENY